MLKAVGPGKPPPPNVNWRGDWGGQPGDRGSGGDRLLAHMRETDNVRSGRTNLDRDSATYTRFVSYNVLSSSLSTPTTFPECDPDALLEENRLQKLTIKLEREITFRSVVCLQEVSIKWSGALHTFFSKNGYHFVFSGYGNRFNGYMGVGIAVPVHDFDILDVDLTRLADQSSLLQREFLLLSLIRFSKIGLQGCGREAMAPVSEGGVVRDQQGLEGLHVDKTWKSHVPPRKASRFCVCGSEETAQHRRFC